MKIVLVGFAASYKTSAGKVLANKLNCRFFDIDAEVERTEGKTVSEIFDALGEKHFRKAESKALQRLKNAEGVVACGGGSVLSSNFAEFAHGGVVVWLQTSAQAVKARLQGGRPLFDGQSVEQLQKLIAFREPFYRKYAEFCVQTDDKTPEEVACEILQKLV